MAINLFGNPSADWVTARLAEIDAALKTVEEHTKKLETDSRSRADTFLQQLRDARTQLEEAASNAVGQGRDANPQLKEQLGPIWDSFEQSLQKWNEIGHQQDDILTAQMDAQTKYWNDFFDRCKEAAAKAQEQARPALIKQIEEATRQISEFQTNAAFTGGTNPWAAVTEAMDNARSAAERAAADFQDSLSKLNK